MKHFLLVSLVDRWFNELGFALWDFNNAIKLDERNISAYYGRGVLRETCYQNKNALNDFLKIKRILQKNNNLSFNIQELNERINALENI